MKSKKLSNRKNFRRTRYAKKNKNVYNLSKKRLRQSGGVDSQTPTPEKSELDYFYNDRFEMLNELNSEIDTSMTNSTGNNSFKTARQQMNATKRDLITKVREKILEVSKINNIFEHRFKADYTNHQSGGTRKWSRWLTSRRAKSTAEVNTTVETPKVDTKLLKVLTFIVAFDNYISNSNDGNKEEIETFLRLHSITETGSVSASPLFKNILFLISKSSKKDYYLNRLLKIAGVSLLCTVAKFRTDYDSKKTPFNADVKERKQKFLTRFLKDDKYRANKYDEDLLQTAVNELVEEEVFGFNEPSSEVSPSLSEYYFKLLYSDPQDKSYSNEKELYHLIHAHVANAPKVTA